MTEERRSRRGRGAGRVRCLEALAALARPATLIAVLVAAVMSGGQSQSEVKVKAAYVFNLTKYIEWPVAKNQVALCVEGSGAQAEALRELNGKVSDARQIVIVMGPTAADLKHCDMLYFAASSGKRMEETLRKLDNASTLTVGEASSFAREGGMIALLTVGDRVRMEVNLAACQRAKLKVSSRLLDLASIVRPERAGG